MGEGHDGNDQMLRSMISFGLTEDLQLSASLPIPLTTGGAMPMGRMMAMMSGNRDFEALAGWRFHRQAVGDGARFESTAYIGGTVRSNRVVVVCEPHHPSTRWWPAAMRPARTTSGSAADISGTRLTRVTAWGT